jgi:alpha-L-arabinofuranosidase
MKRAVFIWTLLLGGVSVANSATSSNYAATVSVDLDQRIGAINACIYGQYLEHVQREDECIYPSIWDSKSEFANETGLRRDVIAAAKELGVPVVRWPGGCFADVYQWKDGIGKARPVRENKHWGGEEPNHFGTDEFLRWCKLVGSDAYINANLGTGTLDECLDWLNYCNATNQRVQFWGIGNETFAPWEAGHMDAKTYSETLAKWAHAVREKSPRIKIMAVGSMSADDSDWDRAVLEKAGNEIDYLTIHNYGISTGNRSDFEAVAFTPVYFEQRLRKMLSVVAEFSARRTNAEPIRLALDEWNIRHQKNGKLDRRDPRTQQDAVFAAGVLNSMIRLSPHVAMANYVFLVNGNGMMLVNSNQIVKTPLFHLFKQYGEWMRGDALVTKVDCLMVQPPTPKAHYPKYEFPADFKAPESPYLDAIAAMRDENILIIALVNRHEAAAAKVVLKLPRGFVPQKIWALHHEDVFAANTFANPYLVTPNIRPMKESKLNCPAHSVSLIYCERKKEKKV